MVKLGSLGRYTSAFVILYARKTFAISISDNPYLKPEMLIPPKFRRITLIRGGD
ncbi:MAG: hypothetical protein ACXAB2_15640 [Candidatus Hodarchaeales archaeon]